MQKLIIFGASTAGSSSYQSLRESHTIIGFCDNDSKKHGTFFCGKPVFDPTTLKTLQFDKIIIASCYAKEILDQLIQSNIPLAKIEQSNIPVDHFLYAEWKKTHSHILAQYKDKYKGEDCFILGNGPSLNKTDLSKLTNHYTFGLNKIFLLFERSPFRPTFHVAINKLVIEQIAQELDTFEFTSFISYRAAKGVMDPSDKCKFIHTGHIHAFSKDITETVIEGSTVTFAAMQIAYYMGFKRVFLIGVDHSFSVSGKPHETQLMGNSDPNHFDPRYFANKKWDLPDLEGSEAAYQLAKNAYEEDGREIYDATIGGKLEVFTKIPFNDAIAITKLRR